MWLVSLEGVKFIKILIRAYIQVTLWKVKNRGLITTLLKWILHHVSPVPISLMGLIGLCVPKITWGVLPKNKCIYIASITKWYIVIQS